MAFVKADSISKPKPRTREIREKEPEGAAKEGARENQEGNTRGNQRKPGSEWGPNT